MTTETNPRNPATDPKIMIAVAAANAAHAAVSAAIPIGGKVLAAARAARAAAEEHFESLLSDR